MLEEKGLRMRRYVSTRRALNECRAGAGRWSARSKAGEIYPHFDGVDIAAEESMPSYKAADRLAERRIAAIAKVRQNFV
jgi:hypothetical protein